MGYGKQTPVPVLGVRPGLEAPRPPMIHGAEGGFRGAGAGALGDLKVPPWGLVRRAPYGSAHPRELMARPVVTYGGNPGQRVHGAWPGSPGRLTHPTLSPTPIHGPPAQPSAQPLLPDCGPASVSRRGCPPTTHPPGPLEGKSEPILLCAESCRALPHCPQAT